LDGYASNTLSFNSKKKTLIIKNQKLTEYDFLFEGGGPGHSIVITSEISRKIQYKLKLHKFRNIKINYYDWFIYYFVRSINCKWHIDKNYYTHYRQHTFNQIGSNLGIKGILSRIKVLLKNDLLKESKKYAVITGLYNKENFKLIYEKSFKSLIFIMINFYKFRRNKIEKIYFLISYLILFFKKN
jgi:rhamnosyltransferase